jgi:DNA polymerase III subunit epsilon
MIFERLLSPDFRRRRRLAGTPSGPLHDYLAVGFPDKNTASSAVGYLALDLETTGGDPERDQIVSFGWVCVNGGKIELATAQHHVVRVEAAISPGSAVIHQITDDEAGRGCSLEAALGELLKALAGRVLIAHRAETELDFVGRACERIYGGRILIPAVDTLKVAISKTERRQQTPQRGALRLHALRQQYNLPRYRAHNALSDALSAAELFLAQQAESGPGSPLKSWLSPSASRFAV